MSRPHLLSAALPALLERRPDHIWVESRRAFIGWGNAARVDVGTGPERYERARAALEGVDAAWAFASFTFDPSDEGSMIIVPQVAAIVEDDGHWDANGDPPEPAGPTGAPKLMSLEGENGHWHRSFLRAIDALEHEEVEKVVLSRVLRAVFSGPPAPAVIAGRLLETQPGSLIFAIDGLVGSSPELLATLQGGALRSTSLAGSAFSHDHTSSSLQDDKVVREHQYAADSVADALAVHCVSLERSERHQADFADISHLATTFDGVVRRGTSILEVIRDLHPTAAVAGTPTKKAIELIREIEAHPRGRYAGPVGWFDRSGEGTFAIAIRCGLIDGDTVTLYAGAGLVAGSDVDDEFAETEVKLTPMLRALGISPKT